VIRIVVLVAILLVAFAAGQYVMNRWTVWTPDTEASVWVAVGTLLLAVATAWSVWETRLVIRSEDRRHQQSLAPSLRLERSEGDLGVFYLVNKGMGLATRVRIQLSATLEFSMASNPAGASNGLTSEAVSYGKDVSQVATDDKIAINVLAGQSERSYQIVSPKAVTIAYEDMFGNPYKTVYTNWTIDDNDSSWEQPEALKVPGSTRASQNT
jgi:hypothetical protein